MDIQFFLLRVTTHNFNMNLTSILEASLFCSLFFIKKKKYSFSLLTRKQQITRATDVSADWKVRFWRHRVSLNGNFGLRLCRLHCDVESKTHRSEIIAQLLISVVDSLSVPSSHSHHHQFDFNQCRVIIFVLLLCRIIAQSERNLWHREHREDEDKQVIVGFMKLLRIWQWHWKNSRAELLMFPCSLSTITCTLDLHREPDLVVVEVKPRKKCATITFWCFLFDSMIRRTWNKRERMMRWNFFLFNKTFDRFIKHSESWFFGIAQAKERTTIDRGSSAHGNSIK